jgi:hypothetical protein
LWGRPGSSAISGDRRRESTGNGNPQPATRQQRSWCHGSARPRLGNVGRAQCVAGMIERLALNGIAAREGAIVLAEKLFESSHRASSVS